MDLVWASAVGSEGKPLLVGQPVCEGGTGPVP